MVTLSDSVKRGSAELAVLAVLADHPLHGYEIARRIEHDSGGALHFTLASLYPLLYRMEERGWIVGRWVEKSGERRKRFYRLTPAGLAALAAQRESWKAFVTAINRVSGVRYA